jgi:glycine cleavage system aminomethyltransferase T
MNFKKFEEQYLAIRKSVGISYPGMRIFEIKDVNAAIEKLGAFVAGRVLMMEPYKMLHTFLLNDAGKIVDIVYLMLFEDKFWIITNTENTKIGEMIQKKFPELGLEEIIDQYGVIAVEGPYSWKIMKNIVGLEVIGLSFLHFMDVFLDSTQGILTRSGNSGEYGYRLFIPKGQIESIVDKIKSIGDIEMKEIEAQDSVSKKVFDTLSAEVRIPILNGSFIDSDDCPIENELRWMIDFRKAEYNGKQTIEKNIRDYQNRVVGFVCQDNLDPAQMDSLINTAVYIDQQKVGTVKKMFYSPLLKACIGYANFDKEWGYVNIEDYYIKGGASDIKIKTASTPFFVTMSNKIQME